MNRHKLDAMPAKQLPTVGQILNEAQISLTVHRKLVKQMTSVRHATPDTFLPELCNCILPVLLEFKVRARTHAMKRDTFDGRGPDPRG